jgi:hypothetical protein
MAARSLRDDDRHMSRTLTIATGTLVAAASAFVLPAWDAALPGGAIIWQVAAVALALVGAFWVRRQLPGSGPWPRARIGRLVATAAMLIALVWIGGVAVLWLVWPR